MQTSENEEQRLISTHDAVISIVECQDKQSIEATFGVMKQLRSDINIDTYYETIAGISKQNQFKLVAAFNGNNECLGVVGYNYDYRLSIGGKMIYIADMVVDKDQRSKGVGEKLMNYVKQEAIREKCKAIVLDSGVQRPKAHKFYLNQGFSITSFNFKITDDGSGINFLSSSTNLVRNSQDLEGKGAATVTKP
jgi:GNAT superfamily N-acetyltransferase